VLFTGRGRPARTCPLPRTAGRTLALSSQKKERGREKPLPAAEKKAGCLTVLTASIRKDFKPRGKL